MLAFGFVDSTDIVGIALMVAVLAVQLLLCFLVFGHLALLVLRDIPQSEDHLHILLLCFLFYCLLS